MELLKKRIIEDGCVLPGNVLKVDSFLNHQIDIDLVYKLGAEWKRLFSDEKITKIMTIEASGIGIACVTAMHFNVPVVFAKRSKSSNIGKDFYTTPVVSFTHGNTYDVIVSKTPAIKQLIDVYEEHGLGVAGVKYVTEEQVQKYCSLKVEPIKDNVFRVYDMIEKPSKDKIFSLLSILGRVVLPPEIFDILDETPKGAGGEIQLTDAMRTLTLRKGMMACEFEGTRYDIGSKLGFLIANVEQGLLHPETAGEFRKFLKGLEL